MAQKKKGLPFVVQPRFQPIIEEVGSEASGVIEIERRGYLTVAEKLMVDQASGELSGQAEMIEAIQAIAEAEGCSVTKVFEDLQNDKGNKKYLSKHAALIASVSINGKSQQDKVKIIAATSLLMSRISSSWTIEETMKLHPDLLDGLYELYLDEDLRSLEAFATNETAQQEKPKKPSADGI